MSSRDASNKNGLVAYPSVSSSLHSLPRATSMSNVSLHPNMYAQRAKESQAKLQHAFTKPVSYPNSPYPNSPLPCAPPKPPVAAPLMMRAPVSLRFHHDRGGFAGDTR
ncbi:hypothetical protein C8F04DRAFT_1099444 [Mycena alexandri]|uniref:Uncharacterized protein n=1 Tax=Mycena alexandri TaxID=1745969 RepID=A0AAD6T0L3_9AGAR|nr:hypothetical protein C8F04DRAFT_1099444 [Mycena alexandri]